MLVQNAIKTFNATIFEKSFGLHINCFKSIHIILSQKEVSLCTDDNCRYSHPSLCKHAVGICFILPNKAIPSVITLRRA